MNLSGLKYGEILKLNSELDATLPAERQQVSILSNITITQLAEILEYVVRAKDVAIDVKCGDYDTIVQDSARQDNASTVIIFWELCNLTDGFQYSCELQDAGQLRSVIDKVKNELDLVLRNLSRVPLVMVNHFSPRLFQASAISPTSMQSISTALNQHLSERLPDNGILVDIDTIITEVGLQAALDLRYFYSSRALYTVEFYKTYARKVAPAIAAACGKAKKALIFDCDNTLWKGILGEDGAAGIEMSRDSRDGRIFSDIQRIALSLSRRGILLGICSKNNPEDVEEVISNHPEMQIRDQDLAITKVNWSDKVSNLKAIAEELNIGLESLVFVDDSDFELELVKRYLPEITTIRVPDKLYQYPAALQQQLDLFFTRGFSAEDQVRTQMYRQQREREQQRDAFANLDDYLASLQLRITPRVNDHSLLSRIVQLTQKTNQFNLTTRRYSEVDIGSLLESDNTLVIAFAVADKFGDSGITGLTIVNLDLRCLQADIDTLLMSCRVIGRNIEYAMMDYIIRCLQTRSIEVITASYRKTLKNSQVSDFYEKCGFTITSQDDASKTYTLETSKYQPKNHNYIEVEDADGTAEQNS